MLRQRCRTESCSFHFPRLQTVSRFEDHANKNEFRTVGCLALKRVRSSGKFRPQGRCCDRAFGKQTVAVVQWSQSLKQVGTCVPILQRGNKETLSGASFAYLKRRQCDVSDCVVVASQEVQVNCYDWLTKMVSASLTDTRRRKCKEMAATSNSAAPDGNNLYNRRELENVANVDNLKQNHFPQLTYVTVGCG